MPRLWPGSRSMRPSASFRRQIMEASASKRETVSMHIAHIAILETSLNTSLLAPRKYAVKFFFRSLSMLESCIGDDERDINDGAVSAAPLVIGCAYSGKNPQHGLRSTCPSRVACKRPALAEAMRSHRGAMDPVEHAQSISVCRMIMQGSEIIV
ncbi:hypothetical protein IQ06DRAFT_305258 [Phaeosphaeriaceae sp. SRC1lsM3a]|nr:hypothetical protein IQ06DRAFT_305258 [Stagonospora sp. SRC1lsM3a]